MQRRTNLVVVVSIVLGAAALGLAGEGTKTFPAPSGGKLILELEAGGTVAIEGTGGRSIEVAYADDCDPACEVQFEETRDGLRIHTGFLRSARSQNSDVDMRVKVPARFDVEVDSMGGGVSIDGVEGSFTGRTAGGDLRLRRVQGEAQLSTMGGDIELTDSELDGSLSTMGGEVIFENVVGDVRGSSMGGIVRYKNVRGRSGRIASPDPDRAGIAEADPETVQISTMGGEIEVEDAPEGADLHTMGGDIDVQDARRFLRATTMGGDIDVQSIDGWVEATTMGGDIEVHVTGDGGDVVLNSMSGEIELSVPEGFGMDLDLEIAYTRNSARDFEITAPAGLRPTVTPEWDHSQGSPRKYIRVKGAVNGGGHTVKVRTINGDLTVTEGQGGTGRRRAL
jgi:DUF4097 and DUF4098 domain-containing protein YvlB